MSAIGPKRTRASALHMSAFGGKADMTFALHMSAFDPKRTSTPSEVRVKVATICRPASGATMRRREFIGLITGSALTWPFWARAQQAEKLPRVGFLGPAPHFSADAVLSGVFFATPEGEKS